jgi:hypothetical protein
MPSEVYQRYYGFMLGFITSLLRLDFAKPGYRVHKLRIEEVMSEMGIEWRLPARHAAFRADENLQRDLATQFRGGSSMAKFFDFGVSAFYAPIRRRNQTGRAALRRVADISREFDLDRDLVDFMIRKTWARGLTGNELIAELMTRAYGLAGMPVMLAPKQKTSCFVIMPFANPFRGYYSFLYQPALRLAGYEAIRAWEGVTNEWYLRMIFALIHRCGAALADVTAPNDTRVPNLNVIHEIGMNMAAGNVTYLIRQPPKAVLPSNLSGLQYMTYDPTASDWPDGQTKQVSMALREMDRIAGRRRTKPSKGKSVLSPR